MKETAKSKIRKMERKFTLLAFGAGMLLVESIFGIGALYCANFEWMVISVAVIAITGLLDSFLLLSVVSTLHDAMYVYTAKRFRRKEKALDALTCGFISQIPQVEKFDEEEIDELIKYILSKDKIIKISKDDFDEDNEKGVKEE